MNELTKDMEKKILSWNGELKALDINRLRYNIPE